MKTDITMVLDRSGSMQSICVETIGGVNSFIEEQRKQPGECSLSLVQFDDKYEPLYAAKPIADAPLLTSETFQPRGYTALLDAIGRTIVETGNRLSAMPEDQRPAKVLFVIVTDGAENASKEYTRDKVFAAITHQKTAYQWDFVFLAANQDAIAVGSSLGIAGASSLTYAHDPKGAQAAFASAASYTSNLRSTGRASFSASDRHAQKR